MGDAHAGTPRGRLKFGIWNDEFGNPARSIHLQLELSTRTLNSNCRFAAIAHHSFAIRHRRFAAGLLRLWEMINKIAVLVAEFLYRFASELGQLVMIPGIHCQVV